ncbi:MAG: chromosomal replication initiator protein DnaA [Acidimicrobiales bacterium]
MDSSKPTSGDDPVHIAEEMWVTCAELIRAQVSDVVWNTTFHGLEAIDLTDDELVVAVPSRVVKERIESRYIGIVTEALHEVSTNPIEMRIDVRADDQTLLGLDATVLDLTADSPAAPAVVPQPTPEPGPLPSTGESGEVALERYTFEDFVTGTGNRFAHAAALSVAETPAKSYNPLFIYGDAGLGKTHLLRAIEHYVNTHYPHFSVRYVSTETFLNEFVDAIRQNTTIQFKRRYREIDVLLVDDIQFVEGKEGLQEEFFHTFNTLHQANRQIVLTSDRPPDSIPTLEDRLRSRFKMGLITDIQPPDIETRMAILQKKAEKSRQEIPDHVLTFIAERVTDNIRELEGALIRVTAYANLTGEALTVDLSQRVLGDLLTTKQPRQITPRMILDETSDMFGFGVDEIIGASRRRPLVTARQVAMYVFREITDLSYPAIAREFGGRDHTTVIHAVDKISNLMAERRQIYDQVTELTARLKNTNP